MILYNTRKKVPSWRRLGIRDNINIEGGSNQDNYGHVWIDLAKGG